MDGILLFNKPLLWTSHDAVDFLRRRLGQKAVGHAGTLDPLATGLLVMLIGKATKLSAGLSGLDKDYEGTMTFGMETDTEDMEGRIVSQDGCDGLAEPRLREIFAAFVGDSLQTPPAFSAVKKEGRKHCDLARQGVVVEREARPVSISRLDLLFFRSPDAGFSMTCSKGTYVRSLCRDIGLRAGCGATLASLVRTRIGPFRLEDAIDESAARRFAAVEFIQKLVPDASYADLSKRS